MAKSARAEQERLEELDRKKKERYALEAGELCMHLAKMTKRNWD